MFYLVKTPLLLKRLYPSLIWDLRPAAKEDRVIYLTFDDGPHPEATPFVLDELKRHHARATFFCIGKNVQAYPLIYKRILMEGHRVGNHTQHHLNGWKTDDAAYINNVREAAGHIDSRLFRPPYGRISLWQSRLLRGEPTNYRIIMWDVLSADFDRKLSAGDCARNVLLNTTSGSIIVFHDSEKAFERLKGALPVVLEHFSGKGYRFDVIP